MNFRVLFHTGSALAGAFTMLFLAQPGTAFDGSAGIAAPGGGAEGSLPTYYESVAAAPNEMAKGAIAGGLPASLHVIEAEGSTEYRSVGSSADATSWEVVVDIAPRPHERIDAVYDLVLALALPEESASRQWRIIPREGTEAASVPVIYGGEKVALKRNVALETSWLPILTGAPSGLPDLSDTGYAWTLWDTVLEYDPEAGSSVSGFAVYRYSTDPSVAAPDPEDPRSAAFVISWIPTLDPGVPPFTIRLDVASSDE